jgi:GNAT superfamily N-acetyltransferase
MRASHIRVASRWLTAATTPLPPSFPKGEPGLLTADEYLEFLNPGDKHHPDSAYDFDLVKMNQTLLSFNFVRTEGGEFNFLKPYGGGKGIVIERDGTVIAVAHGGKMLLGFGVKPEHIPMWASDWDRYPKERAEIETAREHVRVVKYPAWSVALVSTVAKRNRAKYTELLQNIRAKGEQMQLRKRPGKPPAIAILNQRGEIVAEATDEWGASLVVVAREYRGHGLGKVINKWWYKLNPEYTSGGFTPSGQRLTVRRWESRVLEFAERGWYSELVRERRITPARVKEIMSGLSRKPRHPVLPQAPKQKSTLRREKLVYVDQDNTTFIIYDSRFLEDQDDKHILAYGFFRSSGSVGTFLYRIEYEQGYEKLATRVALQMARKMGDPVYVGKGYGDLLEWEAVPEAERDGDYVSLTRDVVPLVRLRNRERVVRRPYDKYGEVFTLLHEQADAKW